VKIAIHHRKNSFSEGWIEYCKTNHIAFKLVDCYRSDIIEQLADCDGLLWNWHHQDPKALLFANGLTHALEAAGKKVFPNSNTAWHFDDKVGQKYLLEALQAPLVPSYTFYSAKEALDWAKVATYPKVFKLRGGAGSANVTLTRSAKEAESLIRKAFGRGFPLVSRRSWFRERIWQFQRDKSIRSFIGIGKGVMRLMISKNDEHLLPKQMGYIYFQDFIPGNDTDTRIVIIGNRAFGLIRKIRKDDFRASGSGQLIYGKELIDHEQIRIAFQLSKAMKSQCMAFDFLVDEKDDPRIVEISYAFSPEAYYACQGYWDEELHWKDQPVIPPSFIIEDFINSDG